MTDLIALGLMGVLFLQFVIMTTQGEILRRLRDLEEDERGAAEIEFDPRMARRDAWEKTI